MKKTLQFLEKAELMDKGDFDLKRTAQMEAMENALSM